MPKGKTSLAPSGLIRVGELPRVNPGLSPGFRICLASRSRRRTHPRPRRQSFGRSGGRVLLVLLRKSHRLSADRRGYKAGRFTYCASERVPREVSVPVSGGDAQATLPT